MRPSSDKLCLFRPAPQEYCWNSNRQSMHAGWSRHSDNQQEKAGEGGCRSHSSFVTRTVLREKRDIHTHNKRIYSRSFARSRGLFQHTLFRSHLVRWPLTLAHLHQKSWLDPACLSQHEVTPSHKSMGSYFGTPTTPPLEPASKTRRNTAEWKGDVPTSIEAVSSLEIGFLNPSTIFQNCRTQSFAEASLSSSRYIIYDCVLRRGLCDTYIISEKRRALTER